MLKLPTSTLACLVLAAPAMAVDYDYYPGGILYNPTRHEYVAPLVKVGHSDDPADDSERMFLRRMRTDGSVIGDISLSDPSIDYLGEPAVAYDAVHDRLFVVWAVDGHLKAALIDAASYAPTPLDSIYVDPDIYPEPARVVFNQAMDIYQVSISVNGVPTIVSVSAVGVVQGVGPAVDGLVSGLPSPIALAANPNSSVILVAPVDGGGNVNVAPFDVNVGAVPTTELFVEQTNVTYLGAAKNKFMATYPGTLGASGYPLMAQILSLGGVKVGAELQLAPDLMEQIGHDLFYHSGRDRVLLAYLTVDPEIVVKEVTTSGGSPNDLGAIQTPTNVNHYYPRLAGETVCNSVLVMHSRDDLNVDPPATDFETRAFGTPCLATLTAEPNPLPFSGTGTVSVRANLGAFKIVSAKIVKGAAGYKIASDKCSGKVVARDQVCSLTIQQVGAFTPGILRVTSDAAAGVDIALNSGGVSLSQIAPSNGASEIDPAAVSLVWSADGGDAVRFKASLCTDAAMTQCQVTSSVVGDR